MFLRTQVKKAEIRTLLQNIDKETAATITFDEFLEMATPKVQNRDEREEIMKVCTLLLLLICVSSSHDEIWLVPFS